MVVGCGEKQKQKSPMDNGWVFTKLQKPHKT